MKLQVQAVFIFLCCLVLVQIVLCDKIANASATIKWTCACSSNHSAVLQLNCSNSCNCSLDGGANGDRWICLCGDGPFPSITSENQDAACFTSCNCTSGSANEVQVPEKRTSSSKVVVVVLLLCILLTTMALVSSIMCYFYRKGKCPIDASIHSSSNKGLSSTSNLISNRATLQETKLNISPSINPFFTGCCFLFKSNPETLHGTICQFSYSELENATDNFSNSNRVGLGGSSCVYRGQLRDGKTVAIKRIKDHGSPDADAVFSTEVDLLSRLNHFHVVPMIGYCSEHRGRHVERLLVFEYVPNGNLRDCLDGESIMNWETRVLIAIGAARGLEYLHEAAAPRILHSDVKSTNILLDEQWRAKITDLGMAKYLKADDGIDSCSSSPARIMQGTFGYFAPEYAIVGRASLKSDVFSFGVVLLELITGRQPIHRSSNNKGEESLVIWATPRLQDSRRVISELPDPRLKGNFPEEEMQIVAYLAKECLLLDPDARPTMTEVIQILSTIAPDKSRMRNIQAGLYQWSSFNSTRAEINPEGFLDIQVKHPIEEEPHKGRPSMEYVERLIILSSNARSWRAQDEVDPVDLVEPRFESFCVSNFKSP